MWFLGTWRSTPTADQLTLHVRAAMSVVAPEWLAAANARLSSSSDPQPFLPVAVPAEDALAAVRGLAATVRWWLDPTAGGSAAGGRAGAHYAAAASTPAEGAFPARGRPHRAVGYALQRLGIVRARRRRYCQFVRAATAHDSHSPLEETAVWKAAAAHATALRGVWRGPRL
eukprot:266410-Chlamydomonas_euryale.AAC.1